MIRGKVQDGVVVLEDPNALQEGTEVAVRPLVKRAAKSNAKKPRNVTPALARLAGKAKGLPRDAARNLDHYLYGHPKR
jgi:hypothetical protein